MREPCFNCLLQWKDHNKEGKCLFGPGRYETYADRWDIRETFRGTLVNSDGSLHRGDVTLIHFECVFCAGRHGVVVAGKYTRIRSDPTTRVSFKETCFDCGTINHVYVRA
jgi:hypothetical protein